jgi:hypothetical protein
MIRDRTRAMIEANKAEIANLLRKAVKAKCEQWDAERAIEKFLGVELELAETIDHFAAGIDIAEDALTIDADEAVKAIIERVIDEGEGE